MNVSNDNQKNTIEILCFLYSSAEKVSVRVGSSYFRTGGIVINVERIIKHKKFNPYLGIDHDYALLKLQLKLNWSHRIGCIELPSDNETVKPGDYCSVAGWGQCIQLLHQINTIYIEKFIFSGDIDNNGTMAEKLRFIALPILNRKRCQHFPGIGTMTNRMICAGYVRSGRGICNRDSGGPLVHNRKVIGITSYGYSKCGEFPDVFARVKNVRKWIYGKTAIKPGNCARY